MEWKIHGETIRDPKQLAKDIEDTISELENIAEIGIVNAKKDVITISRAIGYLIAFHQAVSK